jgi:hypothetical protein
VIDWRFEARTEIPGAGCSVHDPLFSGISHSSAVWLVRSGFSGIIWYCTRLYLRTPGNEPLRSTRIAHFFVVLAWSGLGAQNANCRIMQACLFPKRRPFRHEILVLNKPKTSYLPIGRALPLATSSRVTLFLKALLTVPHRASDIPRFGL